MTTGLRASAILAALVGLVPCLLAQDAGDPWEDPGDDYRQVRGINYLATYPTLDGPTGPVNYFGVASSTAMWRFYNTAAGGTWQHVDDQLSWLKLAGINSVRVFLSYPFWEHHDRFPTGPENELKVKLRHFVGLCAARRIYVMPVLWDSHRLAETEALGEPSYTDRLGLVPTGNPPRSNVNYWHSNPGPSRIAAFVNQHPSLLGTDAERYIQDCVGAFAVHPEALLMWDVINEPKAMLPGHQAFVTATFAIIKGLQPSHKTCFSWGVSDRLDPNFPNVTVNPSIVWALDPNLDVIGLHPYGSTAEMVGAMVWDATHVPHPQTGLIQPPKPVICTEIGNPGAGQSYRDAIGFAMNVDRPDLGPNESGVGFMPWVSCIGPGGPGFTNDNYPLKGTTGLFYGDGNGRVRDVSEVMAFVEAANLQGAPGTRWQANQLVAKVATDPGYVAQGPVPTDKDDYWFLSLILGGSLQDYQAITSWSLFLEVYPIFAVASGSVNIQHFVLHNNANPWDPNPPAPPFTVTAADQAVFNEFFGLATNPGAYTASVHQRYGYPLPGNPIFDPQVDPQDWPVLGSEMHRWAQSLKTYVWGQGGPW